MLDSFQNYSRIMVKQVFELGEIFGFETRNKYKIMDEGGRDIAFAAEQQKGIFSFLFRQVFGHWRTFDIHFYDLDRNQFMMAHHPFRWYFQRLELRDSQNRLIGYLERTFSILSKDFALYDSNGILQMTVSSPFWRIWTFPFKKNNYEVAQISKKWSGIGYEVFTDRDNFLITYNDANLSLEMRSLLLAASIFIDLMYFEHKGSGGLLDIFDFGD